MNTSTCTKSDPRMLDKAGRLTAYAFSCGYIEQKSTNLPRLRREDLYTEMGLTHGVYYVRQYDRRQCDGKPTVEKCRVFWETFTNLYLARQLFDKQPGQLYGVQHTCSHPLT